MKQMLFSPNLSGAYAVNDDNIETYNTNRLAETIPLKQCIVGICFQPFRLPSVDTVCTIPMNYKTITELTCGFSVEYMENGELVYSQVGLNFVHL